MDWTNFRKKLLEAGLTIEEFADIIGRSRGSIYSWKNRGTPDWIKSWLDNYIELETCKNIYNSTKMSYEELKNIAKKVFLKINEKSLIDEITDTPDEKRELLRYIRYFTDSAMLLDEEGNAAETIEDSITDKPMKEIEPPLTLQRAYDKLQISKLSQKIENLENELQQIKEELKKQKRD